MSGESAKTSSSSRADEFIAGFAQARSIILKRIDALQPGNEAKDVNSRLTMLSNDIQQISVSLHDATLFLPAFSIKKRQEEIRELEKALKAKEDLILPKKKFGFKSKLVEPNTDTDSNDHHLDKNEVGDVPSSKDIDSNQSALVSSNFFTIENVSDQSISHEDSELNKNDVLIREVRNSTINLLGSPSTLRLVKLTGCKLLCGPVFTSIFIENCQDCVFFLSCQQLRVHSSQALDIYLRVRSRAVIEDCTHIRFGPYVWDHSHSAKLHRLTEISETVERFDCVDDFNWLAFSTPSPNWSIIPPTERITGIGTS